MHCCAGLTLTCRAEWQCAPPSRPRCSSSRDGGVAAVCQHLRSSGHSHCGLPDSLWSGGHSLFWSLARWTQPLEPGRQPLECCRRRLARVVHSSWHLSGAYDLSIFSIVFCLCCKTGSDSRVALLQMQHLLLLLLQQPVFGMLYGHTSSSCILSTLVILCTCCLDCKRLRWPWCCFNTRERERERVIHML